MSFSDTKVVWRPAMAWAPVDRHREPAEAPNGARDPRTVITSASQPTTQRHGAIRGATATRA